MTYLAVPISANTVESASEMISRSVKAGAEMIELRTDYISELDIEKFHAVMESALNSGLPLIVTCRDREQGGVNDYPAELRVSILAEAVRMGADYVDCEYSNYTKQQFRESLTAVLTAHRKTRLILSAHDFKGPFSDIAVLYDAMLIACPDCIPKLVFEAAHIIDCFDVFDVIAERDSDVIAFAMGESGLISRVLAKKYGSLVSYASIDEQSATAPGQITIKQLKDLYRWDSIDEKTQVFGVVANPVGHSLSPAIHNACFADSGVNSVYLPMLVKGDWIQFKLFMDGIVKRPYLDFRGMSVTIPHKQNALQWMTENGEYIETVAGKIGAVNTLAVGFNERISGYNTDYSGVLDALTCEMGISRTEFLGRKVAVIGAGGVGRAVIAGLTEYGAKVTIYNRTEAKARKLATEFGAMYRPVEQLGEMDAEIVINCTSVGMQPNVDESPLRREFLKEGMVVFDTVYNPPETLLLKYAGEVNARTISGVEMFVRQAMEQFKYFTGKEANAELMRETIKLRLGIRD